MGTSRGDGGRHGTSLSARRVWSPGCAQRIPVLLFVFGSLGRGGEACPIRPARRCHPSLRGLDPCPDVFRSGEQVRSRAGGDTAWPAGYPLRSTPPPRAPQTPPPHPPPPPP